MVLVVKSLPANAGNIRDVGSIPSLSLEDTLEESMVTNSSILALENPMD